MPAEQLEIIVADQKKNPLLGRTELRIEVKHIGQPTPNRQALRTEVGRVSKAPPERVFIRRITTDYGAGISECIANVYNTAEAGEKVEQEYIRTRNAGPQAKKAEEKTEAATVTKETPPPPTMPEAPTPVAESSAESKVEPKEASTKPKTPKKKPAKEKSEEAVPPSPDKKEP